VCSSGFTLHDHVTRGRLISDSFISFWTGTNLSQYMSEWIQTTCVRLTAMQGDYAKWFGSVRICIGGVGHKHILLFMKECMCVHCSWTGTNLYQYMSEWIQTTCVRLNVIHGDYAKWCGSVRICIGGVGHQRILLFMKECMCVHCS